MKITNLEKTPMTKMDMEGAKDTYKQIPISKVNGISNFSFRVFIIMPGGHTPYPIMPKKISLQFLNFCSYKNIIKFTKESSENSRVQ